MKRIMIISALLLSTVFIITPDSMAQEETRATNQNTSGSNRLTKAERKAARIEKRNTKAQDHNSTRSNKTASRTDNSGSTGGDGSGNKAQDHNSTRSNKTASRADNSGPAGGGRNEFIFSLATGYSVPMGVSAAEEDLLFRSGGFSGKMTADYFFGSFGIGLTNGFMVSKADESAFNEYMGSMGYDDTNAAISTADGNSGYLLIGPVFQTGGRFSISIDGRVGLFVSSPASVSGVIKGEGVSIMSVSGSGKSISPGLSAGASFRYAISDRLSLGIGTEYSGTKTGMTYYDGKTGQITTKKVPNQHLTTAVTFSISCGR